MEAPYSVRLEVYEGPLDLLLDLVRQQQINIYDIPIAQITAQYLDYLRCNLERLVPEAAGEFLLMAATLIHIKSRMLLPPETTEGTEETEDPRSELVQQLLEHETFKKAAQMLQQKRVVQDAMWSVPGLPLFLDPEAEPALAVSLYDLVRAFQQVLERAKDKPLLEIASEQVSVGQMMQRLCDLLAARSEPLRLREVLESHRTRDAIVATFLALLELVRRRAVAVRQENSFGEIILRKQEMFGAVYSESLKGVDQEYH
ncbi:MAG: segregation/condensation protein A [Acidobacteria bacterium]|nr:segregation/condensation protein A [Acidobacteriota bacterium]